MTLIDFINAESAKTFEVKLAHIADGQQIQAKIIVGFNYLWFQDRNADDLIVFGDNQLIIKSKTDGKLLSDGQWSSVVGDLQIVIRPI